MAEAQGLREHPGHPIRKKQKPEAAQNVGGIIVLTSEPSIGIEAGIDETGAGTVAGITSVQQQQQEAAAGVIRAVVVGPGAEAEKDKEPPIVSTGAADPQQMLEGEVRQSPHGRMAAGESTATRSEGSPTGSSRAAAVAAGLAAGRDPIGDAPPLLLQWTMPAWFPAGTAWGLRSSSVRARGCHCSRRAPPAACVTGRRPRRPYRVPSVRESQRRLPLPQTMPRRRGGLGHALCLTAALRLTGRGPVPRLPS